MTTSTALATQTRLADAAVSARGGADLLRYSLDDRIPERAFAKNGDGTYTVKGVDLLKVGTFYGMMGAISLVDEDLEAMVKRFAQLVDSGIFVPPFRLDHSWSVLSVVGWFESIETYERVDDGDGLSKLFLRGDVRITGSVEFEAEKVVSAMKRGALRNRSSELGGYVTNAGVELPLVFYGCAYVDIPAVEGLAPVSLSRRPEPHSIVNLSATKGTPAMNPQQIARLAQLRAQATLSADEETERDQLEALASENPDVEIPDVEVEPDDAGDPGAGGTGDGDPAPEGEPAGDPDGDPAGTGDPDPESDPEPEVDPAPEPDAALRSGGDDELTRLRAENARLREERANEQLSAFRTAGAITDQNEAAATALLRHGDDAVREHAATLLGSVSSRVVLGRRRGAQALSAGQNAAHDGDGLIRLGMPKDEVVAVWTSLTSAERKLRQPEYDAWSRDRQEKGVRD